MGVVQAELAQARSEVCSGDVTTARGPPEPCPKCPVHEATVKDLRAKVEIYKNELDQSMAERGRLSAENGRAKSDLEGAIQERDQARQASSEYEDAVERVRGELTLTVLHCTRQRSRS